MNIEGHSLDSDIRASVLLPRHGDRSTQFWKVTKIMIGQIGVMPLDIPVFTFGRGKPVLCVNCCIHGDEPAGLYIASRLIDRLLLGGNLNGTVHIIPVANPAAQFVNSRITPFDLKDLNRIGNGRLDGTLTERIGAQLFEFLSECDLVVNLHEFEMHTPVTAGFFMNVGSTNVRTKTLATIQAFSPEMIWVINVSQGDDRKYQTTLDTALAEAGVVNFPIEVTQLAFLTDAEIDRVVEGLLRVSAYLGILESLPENAVTHVPAFLRREFSTNNSGLWEPHGKLMQAVEVGETIGTLKTLPEFRPQTISSPAIGKLIQIRHRQLAVTGMSLFSVGLEADEILEMYT